MRVGFRWAVNELVYEFVYDSIYEFIFMSLGLNKYEQGQSTPRKLVPGLNVTKNKWK